MKMLQTAVLIGLALTTVPWEAHSQTVVELYGGSHAAWPTTSWSPIDGLLDPVDSGIAGKLDFVGDASNPTAFWAQDDQYLYFRMRLNVASINASSTYADSLFILIDQQGQGNTGAPDYGFAWDTKGGVSEHGLEMQTYATSSGTWGSLRMEDMDGKFGQKTAPPDFRLTGGDGYLRAITDTGTGTSFIDWAVSWDYLADSSGSGLGRDQRWSIGLASVQNATDHSAINADVAGGASTASPLSTGWSAPVIVPEPQTIALLGIGLALVNASWRRGKNR